MSKLRFTTTSGSVYTLDEITEVLVKTEPGQSLRDALPMFSALLVREGVRPLVSLVHGGDIGEPAGEPVTFEAPPKVGERFIYFHPTLYGCLSTPVAEIEEL